jgi:hypothetical protein
VQVVRFSSHQNVARGTLAGVIVIVTAAVAYTAWIVPILLLDLASAFSRRPAAPVPTSITAGFLLFAGAALLSVTLLLRFSRWSRAGVLIWSLVGTIVQLTAHSYFSAVGVEGGGFVIGLWLGCCCILLLCTWWVTSSRTLVLAVD